MARSWPGDAMLKLDPWHFASPSRASKRSGSRMMRWALLRRQALARLATGPKSKHLQSKWSPLASGLPLQRRRSFARGIRRARRRPKPVCCAKACPAGEKLKYYYTNEENGQKLRRYWTNACRHCALKQRCTTGVQRRIARWEHEDVLEAVQKRLDKNPQAMRQRRETVEHPFGTLKMRMGATHFLMKRLPKVATEMALHVLAYNLTRVMNIMGIQPLMAAIRAVKERSFLRLAQFQPLQAKRFDTAKTRSGPSAVHFAGLGHQPAVRVTSSSSWSSGTKPLPPHVGHCCSSSVP